MPSLLRLQIFNLLQEQEMEKQKLLFHQARLANRGVAEMVLLHISACKGVASDMVMKTLQLGISILRGGNIDIQMGMLNHLKEKKDVGFFTSIAGLMNSCSVLDLDAFERNTKAEGLGVGSEGLFYVILKLVVLTLQTCSRRGNPKINEIVMLHHAVLVVPGCVAMALL